MSLRFLNYLVEIFINAFGITRPTEQQRRQVAITLGGFLLLVILAACAVTGFMLYSIHNGR